MKVVSAAYVLRNGDIVPLKPGMGVAALIHLATPLTLIELLAKHRGLFYSQSWYKDEAFLRTLPNERDPRTPTRVTHLGKVPPASKNLPLAVDLANAYVRDPMAEIWDGYLWCRDKDRHGQRVFVGGLANGHGFEIHRHIHITERFGVPSWG